MIEQEESLTPKKRNYWFYVPSLIILGLGAYILLPQIASLEKSWTVVKEMTWWALLLAALMEILSWVGNGVVIWAILANKDHKLSIGHGSLIALGTLSLTMVAGGGVGLAAMIGWIRRETHDSHIAVLAGTLPSLLNNGVLFAVSLVGTGYLLVINALSKRQVFEFILALLILGALTGSVLLALNSKKLALKLMLWFNRQWAALRHKPFDPQATINLVDEFFLTFATLGNGGWIRPLIGAVMNIGFDMAAFYFLFLAAGYPIDLGDLVAGYGFPLAMGKLAFFFPGGVGVVEVSMLAVLNRLAVPSAIGVVVIMGYRLFSMWLPTIFGFAAAAFLSGRLFRKAKKQFSS